MKCRRLLAAIEPWHGNEVVVYNPVRMVEDPWRRTVIDNSFNDGHGLAIADLDQDGADEIIAGFRGAPYGLYVYRHAGETEAWERAPVDEGGVAVSGIVIAHLRWPISSWGARPRITWCGTRTQERVGVR